jgi:hypothetical protein
MRNPLPAQPKNTESDWNTARWTRGHRSPIFDFKLLNAMLVDGDCK